MKILTLDNTCFSLNNLPEELEEDVRFSVLDNSDPNEPDFFFMPLIFLESFSSPAIVLDIGGQEVQMPLDWNLAVGDSETGMDVEILPLTSIADRGFEAFVFNPLTSGKPDFMPVRVVNYYNDVKWYFPKMKNGQLLAVPVQDKHNPKCAFFINDVSRQIQNIYYGKLF